MKENYIKNINHGEALVLKELIQYAEGRVSSKTLSQRKDLSISLFAFDKGEGLNTHAASGDAFVYVLDGHVKITIGEAVFELSEGQTIVMPANIPHGLEATQRFKMLLIVVKPEVKAQPQNIVQF
ncbi:MAG TPA: cupin domain-containing protein [Clostridiales bacterium UBA8960]|jgi:quercetin dioxygenase-like cupin family protein|nr:cupin domain-containing protein [Clostridiales bacterium UBA8960]